MNKVGFFKSLRGSFYQADVYAQFARQSWWRVLLHVFIVISLCAGVLVWKLDRMIAPVVEKVTHDFENEFGRIIITPSGIQPEFEPERARMMPFGKTGQVVYRPNIQDGIELELDPGSMFYLIWSPKYLACLQPGVKAEGWNIFYFETNSRYPASDIMTPAELEVYLRGLREPEGQWLYMKPTPLEITFREFVDQYSGLFTITMYISLWLSIAVQYVFCTVIIASLYRLFSRRKRLDWSFRERWKSALYAGFPALGLASLVALLGLPGLFHLIFIPCLFVGWISMMNRLETRSTEQEEEEITYE